MNIRLQTVAIACLLALPAAFAESRAPEDAWSSYPRPQMHRDAWGCLNGEWDYTITSNLEVGVEEVVAKGKIRVPYAFESKLSGVGRLISAHERMIYRKTIGERPCDRPKPGQRMLLNFEGVDYSTQVFVNGIEATDVPHEGGCLPFSVDITPFVSKDGPSELEVRVWDPTEWQYGGRGKQSVSPGGCFYTRVSGIWQTVWFEIVPEEYVAALKIDTDIDKSSVTFTVDSSRVKNAAADIAVFDNGQEVVRGKAGEPIVLPGALKLWTPSSPHLYTYRLTLGADSVDGYFAMRKVSKLEDRNGDLRFGLNDEIFYPLATLDQGWWPDGLLTPPSEEAMESDLKVLKAYGFNALRKHIKVEPRLYYHMCDKLGLVVLQDLPSGHEAMRYEDKDFARKRYGFSRGELKEMIDLLRNEPCILMWVPYNESWGQPAADLTRETLRWVKRYDPSRLVDGPSGWDDWEGGRHFTSWRKRWQGGFSTKEKSFARDGKPSSDVSDMHSYPGPAMPGAGGGRISFLGEYGGIGLKIPGHLWNEDKSWGYAGTGKVVSREETQKRYLELLDKLAGLVTHGLAGSVYTQTTDVEIEINGLITYDRQVLKYDVDVLKKAHDGFLKKAADLAWKGWYSENGKISPGTAGTYRMYAKTAACATGNPRLDGREIVPVAKARDALRAWTYCGEVVLAEGEAKLEFSDPKGVVFMPAGDPMRPPTP